MLYKLVFPTDSDCSEFFFYLRGKGKNVYSSGLKISSNIMIWDKFEKDDIEYIIKKFPNLKNESYYRSSDILTIAQHEAVNEAFRKVTHDILEVGVHKHNSDDNLHMIQILMGVRVYFNVENINGKINIKKVNLRPNSGCKDNSIRGREKYAGISMKQIQEAFTSVGFNMSGNFREYKEDVYSVKDFFKNMSEKYISSLPLNDKTFVKKIEGKRYNVEQVKNEVDAITKIGVELVEEYYKK